MFLLWALEEDISRHDYLFSNMFKKGYIRNTLLPASIVIFLDTYSDLFWYFVNIDFSFSCTYMLIYVPYEEHVIVSWN